VDVRFDHRAVDPGLAAVVDPIRCGATDHGAIDGLERLGADPLDVPLKRLGRRRRFSPTEAAEGPVRPGVRQVEAELLVREVVHLLQDERPEHLLPGHPRSTRMRVGQAAYEVRVHQFYRLRHPGEPGADSVEFVCGFYDKIGRSDASDAI
jgi:hypothetical protein